MSTIGPRWFVVGLMAIAMAVACVIFPFTRVLVAAVAITLLGFILVAMVVTNSWTPWR